MTRVSKRDGFEVLKEVSKDESLKTIPILVFSTLGQEEDVKKALSLGARDYISKTFFDFEKLRCLLVSVRSWFYENPEVEP